MGSPSLSLLSPSLAKPSTTLSSSDASKTVLFCTLNSSNVFLDLDDTVMLPNENSNPPFKVVWTDKFRIRTLFVVLRTYHTVRYVSPKTSLFEMTTLPPNNSKSSTIRKGGSRGKL